MHIKKIVRLETKVEHIGLYSSDIAVLDELQDSIRHPCPSDDSLLWFKLGSRYTTYHGEEDTQAVSDAAEANIEKWFFGYTSKQQCLQWVYKDEWLLSLHAAGIVVSEYFCNDSFVVEGRTQCIFSEYINRFSYDIPDYFRLAPASAKFPVGDY